MRIFCDKFPLRMKLLRQARNVIARSVVVASPQVRIAHGFDGIELGYRNFMQKCGSFVSNTQSQIRVRVLHSRSKVDNEKTTTDGAGIVGPVCEFVARKNARRIPNDRESRLVFSLNRDFFARHHRLKLGLVDAKIFLDFHHAPKEFVLDGFESKALLRIVGNRLDILLAEELGNRVQNFRFARAGATLEEGNDLPRVLFVDFKEAAPHHHLNNFKDLETFFRA